MRLLTPIGLWQVQLFSSKASSLPFAEPFATFKLKLPQNHKHLPTYYSCSLSPIGCWCHHRQLWRKLSTLRPPNTSSIHIECVNIFPGKKIAWGVHIGCNQPHKSTTGCQIKSMYIIRSEHVAHVWLAEHDVCVFSSPCGLCSRSLCTSLCSLFLLFSTHSNKKSDNLGTLPVFDFCHQTPCENLFCFFLILLSCFPEYDLKGGTSLSFDETLYHRHILCMCVCNLISRNGLNQYCSI